MTEILAENTIGTSTGDKLSRVTGGYESLDVEGTKTAYAELSALLDGLANAIPNLEQLAPHLGKMQSLLSQRGADRKKVLKQWGGTNKKRAGRLLDGRTYDEFPTR